MRVLVPVLAMVAVMAGSSPGPVLAQDTTDAPAETGGPPVPNARLVPLQIEIVVSKYLDGKRTSQLPYTISANANARDFSRLRMGAEVPVPNSAFAGAAQPAGQGQNPTPSGPVIYRPIGTNIDCLARSAGDGRFELDLRIEDASVYMSPRESTDTPWVDDLPVFRSFRATNTLVLADGQTAQFTAATDQLTGEVTRIEVTLKVVP